MDKKANNINNMLIIALIVAAIVIGFLLGKSGNTGKTADTSSTTGEQTEQTGTPLVDIAAKVKVNKNKFISCMKDEKVKTTVQTSLDAAMKAGVPGTPTTVIYDVNSGKSKVVFNALPYEGASGQNYKEIIDGFIKGTVKQTEDDPKIDFDKPSPDKDIWIGDKKAKYAVIVFDDLQCPACRAFHPTLNAIIDQRDDVAVVYRYFPLVTIHPKAFNLALGTECVRQQKGIEAMLAYIDEVFNVGAETINTEIK